MNLIGALMISSLGEAISRLLALDPDAKTLLEPLNGKIIAIQLLPFEQAIFIKPYETGVEILEQFGGEADTTLKGSPLAFIALGISNKPMRSLFSGEIEISGDTHTGRSFQALFEKLDIDWEEQLSNVTGDVAAHRIGNLVRDSQKWNNEAIETFYLNLSEFLQEESRILPTRIETEHFFQDVDQIRADTDRLEARLRLLRERLNPEPSE